MKIKLHEIGQEAQDRCLEPLPYIIRHVKLYGNNLIRPLFISGDARLSPILLYVQFLCNKILIGAFKLNDLHKLGFRI